MKKLITVYELDNAFVLKIGENQYLSYNRVTDSNETPKMIGKILHVIGEKNYRIVKDYEAAKLKELKDV